MYILYIDSFVNFKKKRCTGLGEHLFLNDQCHAFEGTPYEAAWGAGGVGVRRQAWKQVAC